MSDIHKCFDGEDHDWSYKNKSVQGEGAQCTKCGVTEAELNRDYQ